MKKVIFVLSISSVFFGCKKGEKDPFLSLSTRKARMSNEWKIDSWVSEVKQTGITQLNQSINETIRFSLNQSTYVVDADVQYVPPFYFVGTANTEEASWTIDKKGEWTRTLVYNYTTQNYTNVTTKITKGFWNFLGKGNDYKNKERVIFNITYESKKEVFNYNNGTVNVQEELEEYNNGDKSVVYEIVQLKSKEVILKRSANQSSKTATGEDVVTNEEEEYILKNKRY